MNRLLLLLPLLTFGFSTASAQTLYLDEQFGVAQTTGVVFASKPAGSPPADMDLRLELFQPTGVGVPTPRPAIILIHGGGFTGGNRFNGRLIESCERFARRGYACVSIDYRLVGDDPVVGASYALIQQGAEAAGETPVRAAAIAAAAEDGYAAYEWLVANAGALGVDTDRIGIGGSSAGAATSLIVAYILDKLGIAPPGAFAGVFDMWGTLAGSEAFIAGTDAPLLIAHGENDGTVPVSGAYALEARALAVGLPYEMHIVPGAGHGFDLFSVIVTPGETMFDRWVAFFYDHVATATPPPPPVPATSPLTTTLLAATLLTAAAHRLQRGRSLPFAKVLPFRGRKVTTGKR